jgi:hypothetical protein
LGALRREMGLREVLGGWIELVGFVLGWRDGWREVLDPGVAWVAWWVYGPFTVRKGVIGVCEGRG